MSVVDEASSPEPPQSEPGENLATMTLFEHLAELRMRLMVSIGAVVVTTIVVWFFYDHLLTFMRAPYCNFVTAHPTRSITGKNCAFVISSPLEGFTTRLKICAYAGIALATPVLFWELWRFITPGLHKNEKRYIVPFVSSGAVLFAAGVSVAILVFPKALTWLIEIGGNGVDPLFTPARYLTLYMLMCIVFGAIFTYPLIVVFLELAGVVSSAKWRRWRRPAIVVLALVAAVATPSSDPFSFLALLIPMLVMYEGSILIGRLLHK